MKKLLDEFDSTDLIIFALLFLILILASCASAPLTQQPPGAEAKARIEHYLDSIESVKK
jgi:outer membrane lipoprotein-sorting protein